MSDESNIELFQGELVVRADGLYTFAHHYVSHRGLPETVIVGTNHAGDKEYFEQIAEILATREIVLYEGIHVVGDSSKEQAVNIQVEANDLKDAFSPDTDIAFLPAMRTYFRRSEKHLRLVSEWGIFDYSQPHWIPADAEFFQTDEKWQEKMATSLQQKFASVSEERKQAVVEHVRRDLESMEQGQFRNRDFANGFAFFFSDPMLVGIFTDALGKPRDEAVFRTFDTVIKERNPQSIGIKFGAGHTAYQRSLVEQRGYVLQNTVALRNLNF